jgi:hypothetical protein
MMIYGISVNFASLALAHTPVPSKRALRVVVGVREKLTLKSITMTSCLFFPDKISSFQWTFPPKAKT